MGSFDPDTGDNNTLLTPETSPLDQLVDFAFKF